MIVSQLIRQSKNSEKEWESAQKLIPGGVNSPVRAFRSVGGSPPFISSAKGSSIVDVDGNSYIDYIGSWGPMILGHSNETVLSALQRTMQNGTSYGAPTPLETQLAELIISGVPSIEMVRMVNSGTEATMSAIRLARGYTKRDKIIKVEGCYHGHADYLLAKAGSGITTLVEELIKIFIPTVYHASIIINIMMQIFIAKKHINRHKYKYLLLITCICI